MFVLEHQHYTNEGNGLARQLLEGSAEGMVVWLRLSDGGWGCFEIFICCMKIQLFNSYPEKARARIWAAK